jgi:DNA-binding response OmpR family regulator
MLNTDHILLAEDDPDYASLFQVALGEAGISNPVDVVHDGLKAIEYLKEASHTRPAFIVLDLKLPVYHGFDVLRWIRSQPQLRDVYVTILSGSGFENESGAALKLGADRFLVKPAQFSELVAALAKIRDVCLHDEQRMFASSEKH